MAVAAEASHIALVQAAAERRFLLNRRRLAGPATIIVGVFGVLPLIIMLIYSFLVPATYGGVEWKFTIENYVGFLFQRDIFDDTLQFVPDYLQIYFRTFVLAGFTTVASLILGFPTAYFMATRPPSQRNFWVFLITLPFWTNLLIRTYAIQLIIRDEGLVNDALKGIGVIDQPLHILYTNFAIMLGLLYSFLPFMVLPLYTSLEKLDFRLVEAGFDLYATRSRVLRRIVIPLAKPGIIAGCILVFIPALGAYVTPLILGGGKQHMIGSLIATQFGTSRNWPFGCALAFILMAIVLLALLAYVRSTTGKAQVLHG
ncbi:MAG TPA: ABC transporter permease [Candidatus Angelobacter sp.]|nr:ABC transporter permease [Candidatus Angelobacter sp.]